VAGACQCGDELSGSIKCGKFLDYIRGPASFSRRTLLNEVIRELRISSSMVLKAETTKLLFSLGNHKKSVRTLTSMKCLLTDH
jgi:hypothetical protein